ncbi:MAG: succinyldiaminopimelate transaminase [Pseudomonadota bacterium]
MTSPSNPGMAALAPYPFEKLDALLRGNTPPESVTPIPLSIGEPRHTPPDVALAAYRDALVDGVSRYPTIRGSEELRGACADWLARRFNVTVDPGHMVQPVTGTREALFAAAQVFCHAGAGQTVLMPNPFYQIYEGAALLAGAAPDYLNVTAGNNFLPDLDAIAPERLDRARLFYLCNPVNPCGTVADLDYLKRLVELAQRHDFIVLTDECYIELYRDTAPVSMLNAAAALGNDAFERVLVFHSLSKRSNLPGMRSGFVAGDAALIGNYGRYRTYHGCSMSLAVQAASIAAWNDDAHVADNRAQYNHKYAQALPVLATHWAVDTPAATFYVWLPVGGDETEWARRLHASTGVTVVPGRYLARTVDGRNPGEGYVRLSLVASPNQTLEAIQRVVDFESTQGD